MKITINGKEYTFVFSIEASLYDECVSQVPTLLFGLGEATSDADFEKLAKSMSNIPKTALTMFYAGLLEKHSQDVPSIDSAKDLIKSYLKENPDKSWYDILSLMLEQMGDDGFFKLVGLEQMLNPTDEPKTPKVPQDHKKKTTKPIQK